MKQNGYMQDKKWLHIWSWQIHRQCSDLKYMKSLKYLQFGFVTDLKSPHCIDQLVVSQCIVFGIEL